MANISVTQRRGLRAWHTRDIMVLATIGLVFGVLMAGLEAVILLLLAINPLFLVLVGGLNFLSGVLAMYVIRRPGAALLARLLQSLVQSFFSTFAFFNIIMALIWGTLNEVPFLATRYRTYRLWVLLLSGALTGLASATLMYFFLGISNMSLPMQIIWFVSGTVCSALEAGWGAKVIGDLLTKTGILHNVVASQEE